MTVVNLDLLRKNLSNDSQFIAEMITLYLHNIPVQIDKLEKAIKDRDRDNLKNVAHQSKASANALGMHGAHDLFKELEQGSSGNCSMDQLESIFSKIKKILNLATTELENELTRIKKEKK